MCYFKEKTYVRLWEEGKMKEAEKKTGEFLVFTLVSALISFGYNVVLTVIPLRMADRGLGYGEIGGVMSAVAVGLMVIKLAVGHLIPF